MQKIIQITIGGRLIPIEEDAYLSLREYNQSLKRHFSEEEGRDEIIEDIEYRIAELFSIRLQTGAPCIDVKDVQKVIETLGAAYTISAENTAPSSPYLPEKHKGNPYQSNYHDNRRLYRNPQNKILGGVCSGLGSYFDIDPVIIRLVMVVLFLVGTLGLWAYLIAWIVIPMPRTPQELENMTQGEPLTFDDLKKNVTVELKDLKHKAEAMSNELKDFFSSKK
jgi:phage shock protein C